MVGLGLWVVDVSALLSVGLGLWFVFGVHLAEGLGLGLGLGVRVRVCG